MVIIRAVLTCAVCAGFWQDLQAGMRDPGAVARSEYIVDTWETEDGLPGNSATAIVQTADGYLWFGTFNGLVRFDGVHFEVFDPKNTPALPGPGIVNLHLDRAGRMWVSTLDGMALRDDDGWRRLGAAEGWTRGFVRDFAERHDGSILASTFDGRFLEWNDGRFTQLPSPSADVFGTTCAADDEGRWWVAKPGFIGMWSGEQWTPVLQPSAEVAGLGCGPATDGGVWVVVGSSLRKYVDGVKTTEREIEDLPRSVWDIFEDSAGNVWVNTHDAGVRRIAPDGSLDRWGTDNGLVQDSTRFVFEDRERNIWIGTNGGGLSRLKPRRVQMYGVESGITERVITSVWPLAGAGVLVGTNGRGLFRLNGGLAEHILLPVEEGSASYVQSVLQDRSGRIWAGTFGEALFLIDERGTHHFDAEQLGGHNILALFEDSRGRIWISAGSAIAVMENEVPRLVTTQEGSSLYGACAFAEDPQGNVLVTNQRGVFRVLDGRLEEVMSPSGAPITDVQYALSRLIVMTS
jgi:ligand-binding sensor domain-containing protein